MISEDFALKAKKIDYKARAIYREAILREHYEKHGRLLIADIKRLLGVSNVSTLRASLSRWDCKIPPVWDTHEAIAQRKVETLNRAVKKLGKDWLSPREAADALEKTPADMYGLKKRLKKKGLQFPEIRQANQRECQSSGPMQPATSNQSIPSQSDFYSEGLQVLSVRQLPDKQMVYLLR